MKQNSNDRDPIEALYRKMNLLEKRVKELETNPFRFVPIYDSTNFPQEAVDGQVCIAPVS